MRLPKLVVACAVASMALSACGSSSGTKACGWDFSSAAGQQAQTDRLNFVDKWLFDHPGDPVPAPTSTYWRGDCPVPADQMTGPPDHEDS